MRFIDEIRGGLEAFRFTRSKDKQRAAPFALQNPKGDQDKGFFMGNDAPGNNERVALAAPYFGFEPIGQR